MNKFLSLLAAGTIALASVTPALAAATKHRGMASRYHVNINDECRTRRGLKRAECARQFHRDTDPMKARADQMARACQNKLGTDKADCLNLQRRFFDKSYHIPTMSSSSSSSMSSASSTSSH